MNTPRVVELPPLPTQYEQAFWTQVAPVLDDPNKEWGEKVLTIYAFVDSLKPYLSGFVSCSRGCSACCRGDVYMTIVEAELISLAYDVPVRRPQSVTNGHRTACPFLDGDGACSVYEYRPLACRMLFAVGDSKDCMTGRVQGYYGQPPAYGNDLWKGAMTWLHTNAMQLLGEGHAGDVRDFFEAK